MCNNKPSVATKQPPRHDLHLHSLQVKEVRHKRKKEILQHKSIIHDDLKKCRLAAAERLAMPSISLHHVGFQCFKT